MTDYDPDELVSLADVAERTGVPYRTLQSRLRVGTLQAPAKRVGRIMFWHWRDVAGLRVGERALGRPQAKGDG